MMKLLYGILSLVICSCGSYHSNLDTSYRGNFYDPPPKGKPGSCYAKCLIGDKYDSKEVSYLKYMGSDYSSPYVKKEKIIIEERSTKWEKKKSDKNCLSANPDDCLVWCQVEQPERFLEYYTVQDTHMVKEFEYVTEPVTIVSKGGNQKEWREVVCAKDINEDLLYDVSDELNKRGYVHSFEGSSTPEFKSSLIAFQKDNQLPIGQLDFETLDSLAVDY